MCTTLFQSCFKYNKMIYLLVLCCLSGCGLSLEVRQSHSDLTTDPGDRVEIFCSHNKTDYRVMLWYQRSPGDTAMKLIGYLNYKAVNMEEAYRTDFNLSGDLGGNTAKKGSLIILSARKEHSAVYYCAAREAIEAYFGGGTKLTVLDPDQPITAPKVKVFPPSPKECEKQKEKNRKKTIVCVADGFYPDHVNVSWTLNGEPISSGVATDGAAKLETGKKTYRISSRLRVSDENWHNPDNEFNCTVSFFNKITTVYESDSVYGVEAKEGPLSRETYLKVTQSAKLSYTVFIVKSCFYGAFVTFLVLKLQSSAGNQKG